MSDFLRDTSDALRRTPAVLEALLVGLPTSAIETPDVEGGWRPRDVVGHLITAELDDWIPRTRRILADGTAVPFDPFDRFAHADRDTEATLDELIERFAQLRTANLAELERLVTDADLERRGRHQELLATWVVHDLDHVSQIFAGLAASRDADVGPWKAYLGILLRRDDPAAIPG